MTRSLLLAITIAALAPRANAQNVNAEADALFDKGKQLMAANKLAEACTAFEDSQRLAAAATTEMNLANCREKNAQLVTAHDLFTQVAKELEGKTDKGNLKLREVALARAGALAPKLSKLTLIVPSASQVPGLELQLDARTIDAASWNQPMVLDGGTYKLVARASDRIEWSTSIVIAPSSDTKTLEVPMLVAVQSAPRPKPAPVASGSRVPIVLGIAALGLGGAALGFELWGRSIYGDAEAEQLDRDRQVDLWDQANTRHYVAQVAGVAAVGCAAAAIILYVTRDKPTETPAIAITPVTSPTTIGISVDARW